MEIIEKGIEEYLIPKTTKLCVLVVKNRTDQGVLATVHLQHGFLFSCFRILFTQLCQ